MYENALYSAADDITSHLQCDVSNQTPKNVEPHPTQPQSLDYASSGDDSNPSIYYNCEHVIFSRDLLTKRVIKYVVSLLRQSSPLHYDHIVQRVSNSTPDIWNYFCCLSSCKQFAFFKRFNDKFIIDSHGMVSLSPELIHAVHTTAENITAETTVVDFICTILRDVGPLNYETLIRCTNECINIKHFFDWCSEERKMSFFENHSSNFKIDQKTGIVSLLSSILDETIITDMQSVVKFTIGMLKSVHSFHYKELSAVISSMYKFKDFSPFYDDNGMFWFFKKFPEYFKYIDSYHVTLATSEGDSGSLPEQKKIGLPEVISKSHDLFPSVTSSRKKKEGIDYLITFMRTYGSICVHRLPQYFHDAPASIRDYFNNFNDSQVIEFFSSYPDIFVLQNNVLSIASKCDLKKDVLSLSDRRTIAVKKVIKFFISLLNYLGAIHYEKLSNYIRFSSAEVQDCFDEFVGSCNLSFFAKHPKDFLVLDHDCVIPTPQFNFKKALQEKISPDEIAVSFFMYILRISGTLRMDKLLGCLSKAPRGFQNDLKFSNSSRVLEFFRYHDSIFKIEQENLVSLVFYDETNDNVANFLALKLKYLGQMHYKQLIFFMKDAPTNVKNFFYDWTAYDKRMFFETNKQFDILPDDVVRLRPGNCLKENQNCVAAIPKLELMSTIIRYSILTLGNRGSMRFDRLIRLISTRSPHISLFFQNVNRDKRISFFKLYPEIFRVYQDDQMVMLLSQSLNIQNAIKIWDDSFINIAIAILQTNNFMNYRKLVQKLSEYSSDAQHFFSSFDDCKMFWFFKSRPEYFVFHGPLYVYLTLDYSYTAAVSSTKKHLLPNVIVYVDNSDDKLIVSPTVTKNIVTSPNAVQVSINLVIDCIVVLLKKFGPMYYETLLQKLSEVSSFASSFFNSHDTFMKREFFESHACFSIDQNGHVSLNNGGAESPKKITKRHMRGGKKRWKSGSSERKSGVKKPFLPLVTVNNRDDPTEAVVTFLVTFLQEKHLHFLKLANLTSTSEQHKHFFDDYSDNQKYDFFRCHSNKFVLERNGYVKLK